VGTRHQAVLRYRLQRPDTRPGQQTGGLESAPYRRIPGRIYYHRRAEIGPDGLLYALELSDFPGGFPNPGDDKVLRINADGSIRTIVTGLTLPGSIAFGPDNALYITNNGDLGPGKGQILRVDIPK
jgi:hypothetical protein